MTVFTRSLISRGKSRPLSRIHAAKDVPLSILYPCKVVFIVSVHIAKCEQFLALSIGQRSSRSEKTGLLQLSTDYRNISRQSAQASRGMRMHYSLLHSEEGRAARRIFNPEPDIGGPGPPLVAGTSSAERAIVAHDQAEDSA